MGRGAPRGTLGDGRPTGGHRRRGRAEPPKASTQRLLVSEEETPGLTLEAGRMRAQPGGDDGSLVTQLETPGLPGAAQPGHCTSHPHGQMSTGHGGRGKPPSNTSQEEAAGWTRSGKGRRTRGEGRHQLLLRLPYSAWTSFTHLILKVAGTLTHSHAPFTRV